MHRPLQLRPADSNPREVAELALGYPAHALHNRATLADVLSDASDWEPWLVYESGFPVGVFVLRQDPRESGRWMTTTYVDPASRRRGISRSLKLAALSATRAAGVELIIYVQNANTGSQASIARVFPEAVATPSLYGPAQRYDLRSVPTPADDSVGSELLVAIAARLAEPRAEPQ